MPPVVDVHVDSLHPKGYGLGRSRCGEVAAWGALPGEQVAVRLLGGGATRCHGVVDSIHVAHPERVLPFCSRAGVCGGCTIQHWSLTAQRQWKWERIVAALGDTPPLEGVEPVVGIGDAVRFRAKYMPMLAMTGEGRLALGLYRAHSHDLVPIDDCPVQDGATLLAARAALPLLVDLPGHGWLRGLLLRSNGAQVLATLLLAEGRMPAWGHIERLAQSWLETGTVVGVAGNVSDPASNAVVGPTTRLLAGVGDLIVTLGDVSLRVGPTTFVQTHLEGAVAMIQAVRAFAGEHMGTVVDLFAGAGMFALALAPQADRVVAVEAWPEAAAWARINLAAVPRAVVYGEDSLAYVEHASPADVVVVDPPRAGCGGALLRAVQRNIGPEKIVYVSCHLDSFARDSVELAALGYALVRVRPIDVFPHTTHTELVAWFCKSPGACRE